VLRIFVVVWLTFFASGSFAITVGEIIDPVEAFLECRDLSRFEQAVCTAITEDINQQLDDQGISFSDGDLIISTVPVSPRKIDTGHSCTHKAKIKSSRLNIRFNRSGEFDLNGNTVSEPLIVYVNMPVNAYGRIDIKEEWGFRSFGCTRTASDSYYADASANITAELMLFVSLEPKMSMAENGDYLVTVKPIVEVMTAFDDIDLDFDFHGKSILNGLGTLLHGGISSFLQGLEAAIKGDSASGHFEQFGIDIGIGSFQTIESVSSVVYDDFLLNIVELVAELRIDEAAGVQTGILERRLRNDIYQDISQALNLDANGERTFVIPRGVVDREAAKAVVSINSLLL